MKTTTAIIATLAAIALAPIPGTPDWFIRQDAIDDAPRARAGSDFQRWQAERARSAR